MIVLKKITAVIIALCFALVLCSCGENGIYATDETIGEAKDNDMDAILSGTFYFDAQMTSYGETGKTVLAIDGANLYMRAEMDGVEMGLIYMGDTMYMLYGGQYAELSKSVLKMMEIDVEGDIPAQLGFNKEEILSMFMGLGTPTEEKGELDGVKISKLTYDREDGGKTVAYLDKNGDMLRAESYSSSSGALIEEIDFVEVSGIVPTELFILDNYEKTNILKMMYEISQVMDMGLPT